MTEMERLHLAYVRTSNHMHYMEYVPLKEVSVEYLRLQLEEPFKEEQHGKLDSH